VSGTDLSYRRYQDNDTSRVEWKENVIASGESYACPTYVHRTPPWMSAQVDISGWACSFSL